jgi:hypothetical protein
MDVIEREKRLYRTPSHITKALLEREIFLGSIWESAAGKGDLATVLRECGYNDVRASDIHDWGFRPCGIEDFLTSKNRFDCLVTNLPYNLKWKFLAQAKRLIRHKIAMLLPLEAEYTKTFARLHQSDHNFPWKALYSFLERIPWVNLKNPGGKIKFGWFVFERGYRGSVLRETISFRRRQS